MGDFTLRLLKNIEKTILMGFVYVALGEKENK